MWLQRWCEKRGGESRKTKGATSYRSTSQGNTFYDKALIKNKPSKKVAGSDVINTSTTPFTIPSYLPPMYGSWQLAHLLCSTSRGREEEHGVQSSFLSLSPNPAIASWSGFREITWASVEIQDHMKEAAHLIRTPRLSWRLSSLEE